MHVKNMVPVILITASILLASCSTTAGPPPAGGEQTAGSSIAVNSPVKTETPTAIMETATPTASLTPQATATPAPPTATPVPYTMICKTHDLIGKFMPGVPATGGLFLFSAVITNISSEPCLLDAWPQIQVLDSRYRLLEVDLFYTGDLAGVEQNTTTGPGDIPPAVEIIELEAGSSLEVKLSWRNWCGAPLSEGVILRLNMISNAGVVDIPAKINIGCDYPSNPSVMGITRLVPAILPTPTATGD